MENTTSTAFTADSQSPNNNSELKNADNIDDCQLQEHQRMQRSAGGNNGRWCTSSVRSRSSTSFLIHNLLISCSDDTSDGPTTKSPPSLPLVEQDNENEETSSSSSESRSRSCSPQDMPLSSPVVNVKDEDYDVNGMYNADSYRIKRRKCTIPFRRRTTKKKDSISTNTSGDSDNEKRESKRIINILHIYLNLILIAH